MRTKKTGVVLLLLAAVVVASCGTRLNDDEQAFFAGAGMAGDQVVVDGSGNVPGSTGRSSVTTTTRVAGGSGGGTGASGDGGSGPGTPEAGGGDGGGGQEARADGGRPCAQPSSEVGVTDDTLTLGGVFQLSGLIPGFAQTAVYGAQAYAEFLNANGGLCGRQVEYVVLDDAFDASRNADQTAALIQQALSLVGGFSAADNGGAGVLEGTNVLDVSVATTQTRARLPNFYPIFSTAVAPDEGEPLPEYRYALENGADELAIVYVAAAAGRDVARRVRQDATAAGMKVVLELEVQPTQFSYASTARAVAESGAQMVISLLEINGSVQLAEELTRLDHDITYPFYRLGYDQRFLDQAGAAADGAVNFIEFKPFEEAGTNEALDNFLAFYDQVAPGEAPTFQAMQGWAAMELYTQLIRRLEGPISRDALVAAAANFGEVDGKGLFAPFDFASKERAGCKVVVRAKDGRYQREAPSEGFYC